MDLSWIKNHLSKWYYCLLLFLIWTAFLALFLLLQLSLKKSKLVFVLTKEVSLFWGCNLPARYWYIYEVSISNIVVRNEQHRRKTIKVNCELKELWRKKTKKIKTNLIDQREIIIIKQVNGLKLHLNKSGKQNLKNNFEEAISN